MKFTKQKRNRRFRPNKNRSGRRKQSQPSFDLGQLIKTSTKGNDSQANQPAPLFSDMQIDQSLLMVLKQRGFNNPTRIQQDTFEAILEGRDILGIANTGTGKTGAFLMPIIQRLLTGEEFQTLVVVPTRELAQQVQKEFYLLTKGMKLYSSSFIGGTSLSADFKALSRKNHLIIGTPGRLIDLIQRKALKLGHASLLVLDEFDRMLDMGFVNDVRQIAQAMKSKEQTLLFSATENKSQNALVAEFLHQPITVRVHSGLSVSNQINQKMVSVGGRNKDELLIEMLTKEALKKVLVFAETKRQVNNLEKVLSKANISTGLIHGNKTQGQRKQALDRFRNNKIKVLVATDLAARGIDVADISHVINFEVPRTEDSYIHRIGRTGRAGKTGTAITFID